MTAAAGEKTSVSHPLDRLVEALLYEGYILYPYRSTSTKNQQQRFTFGRVYPRAYHESQDGREPCRVRTQCLWEGGHADGVIKISLRFLQPVLRQAGYIRGGQFAVEEGLQVGGKVHRTWQEARERLVEMELTAEPGVVSEKEFEIPEGEEMEILETHGQRGTAVCRRWHEGLRGRLEVALEAVEGAVGKVTVTATNVTPCSVVGSSEEPSLLLRTFASTHLILRLGKGHFLSQTDPPPAYREASAGCRQEGCWPILVGDQASEKRHTMLASPIILEDFPRIAEESPGSLYDGTEIDEILTLRILTMSEEEKREMREIDERARLLLERTEALDKDGLMRLHGVMRGPGGMEEAIFGGTRQVTGSVRVGGVELRPGDAVIVKPRSSADAFDLLLANRRAVIEAWEEDAEGKIHAAVVLDDDPGRDLGLMRQPGHRFFYGVDEIEPAGVASAGKEGLA